MIGDYIAGLDFSLFEPNVFSTASEKKLIELLLNEDFIDDPWLQRRLSCYVLADTMERDRIVLEIVKFFFRGKLPNKLLTVEREFDSVFAVLGMKGHFVHQFEVLIFGWALIRMLIEHNKSIKKSFRFNETEDIFIVWLAASVTHDFGYPLQLAKDVMKKFLGWYQILGITDAIKLYKKLIKDYEKIGAQDLAVIKSQDEMGFITKTILLKALQDSLKISRPSTESLLKSMASESNGKSHGYTGALVFYEKCSHDFNAKKLKLALAAICLHDLPDDLKMYIKKIDFWCNPYAYLLFLIDNLQEWFRNLRPNEKWPSYNLFKINKTENQLELSYILTHEQWEQEMEDRVKSSVRKKFSRLNMMTKPDPPLNFQIAVNFRTNHGKLLGAKKFFL